MESGNISRDKWIAIKIFLTVYLISALFFKPSVDYFRFVALTKALVHYGTTWVDEIQKIPGIQLYDFLTFNGHTYIEPFPGLSFISMVSYLPYSVFFKTKLISTFSLDPFLEFKISQFVMALSTVTLFTALLITVFFLSLRWIGCDQKKAIMFSFLLYFGTPVIFYSLRVFNGQDILHTSLVFIAFFIIFISKMQNITLVFFSGLLWGLAVFVNGIAAFFLPLFLFIILAAKQRRNAFFWIAGAILGFTPLLIYNQISFGNLLLFTYNIQYPDALPLHLAGFFSVARTLLISPRVGLLFFFPFVIALVPIFKKMWNKQMNRFIFCSVLIYIVCICVIVRSLANAVGCGNRWYFYAGTGGPRFLLPIIPFLLYVIAGTKFDLEWKKNLTSSLAFISIIINIPGLFWTGGQCIFFSNLLTFCKNGFHSYMIDLIRDMLVSGGFNIGGLSIFPLLTILGIFLWWIWKGNKWIRNFLR